MNWREYIHSEEGILGGKPVFRGTRYTVERVLKLMGAGWDAGRIGDEFPGIESHHLQAAAGFAADLVHDESYVAIGKSQSGLRFLCDNNIGSTIARALTMQGHDVERAIHAVPGASDPAVMAYAVASNRMLVTCDRDFGELVFRYGETPPPSIIYIRFEPQQVLDILPRLFAVLDSERLDHHITVIGDDGDRRTAFPRKSANDG